MSSETQYPPQEPEAPARRSKLTTAQIADALLETEHFALDAGGRLYAYRNGAYQSDGERHLRSRMKRHLKSIGRSDEWSNYRTAEVRGYIEADAPALWERPPLGTLNLANGLLDIETRSIRPHDTSFLTQVQLPVSYDPEATCPFWDTFVSQILSPDCAHFPFELACWLMLPNRNIQKCALLLGEGANGKSTLMAAIVAFLGKRNCIAIPLQKIENDRFSTARLVGKLANICPDIPSSHLQTTDVFKKITGDDTMIDAEHKHIDGFSFDCFARLVFSANQPPTSSDSSDAFFRRWIVVPFEKRFSAEGTATPRDALDPLLQDPAELSGVLNRALDCLPAVHLSTTLTETTSMNHANTEFRRTTDPFGVWLDQNTVDDPAAFVVIGPLMTAYNAHAARANRILLNPTSFGIAIDRVRPGTERAQRRINGKREKVLLGIKLKETIPA